MREILFRGKRYDDGSWVEGYLIHDETCNTHIPYIGYLFDGGHDIDVAEIILGTVGQFTGLTDKNGKKIFEGDIGRYKQTDGAKRKGKPIICTGFVIYNAKTASYAVESKDDVGAKNYDYFPIKDFEVIGNIHDNPERLLLEDKRWND